MLPLSHQLSAPAVADEALEITAEAAEVDNEDVDSARTRRRRRKMIGL